MVVVVKDYITDNFSSKEQLRQEVLHEAQVISQLGDHRNLPLLYGICTINLPYKMVLQFHGIGEKSVTLHKAVKTKKLTNEQWFDIVKGVAAGLNHVHARGYLHNDLKVNNVVFENSTGEYHSVIINFGKSSKISANSRRKNLSKEEQLKYTASYPHIAPEIVDGSSDPSIKSDVFSFAKLLQFVEKHSSFEIGGRVGCMAYSAALLQNPKMRPTLMQIINYNK
ncbi:sporulation protein kinase pit1-like [Actinia tenebrosa]|uniref:Sporulation protein kinase pit1-like n=1 Tax=Actinia tenebrosa TaxID=6105 RepID=A0A6P8ICG1_ACTTE|nr:sporulation protein kinase pit1-like [Actinia tenebrosa]